MQLLVQSATGVWIESDSKIEVTGMLAYQETEFAMGTHDSRADYPHRHKLYTSNQAILNGLANQHGVTNQAAWSPWLDTVLITNGQWT